MRRFHANLLLLVTAFIWGTAFVAQQHGMKDIGPLYFTGLRFLMGGLFVLPLAIREYRRFVAQGGQLTRGHWIGMAICGVFLFTGAFLQQVGLLQTSVTNAGFLTGVYVPMVPVIVLLVWRKLPHWSIWPAAFGCLAGTYLLSGGSVTSLNEGDMWVLAGSIFWALQVIAIGRVVQSCETPILVACVQFLWCSLFGLIGAQIAGEALSGEILFNAGPELIYAGIFSVGIAFTCQAVAQRYTSAADAAIIMSGEMIFAALAGAMFLGERLSMVEYLGCGLMFVCILSVELLPLLRKKRVAQPA